MSKGIGTVESVINNKQVLHNGDMGVYVEDNFSLIEPEEVQGLDKKVEDLYKYLSLNTKYKVNKRTFGVEVETYGGKEKAFVGYDESIDSTYRLCYTSNTFLSMDILRKMGKFNKPKESVKVKQGTGNKGIEKQEIKKTLQEDLEDFGWGTSGKETVLDRIEQNINRACNVFKKDDVNKTRPSQVQDFNKKALRLVDEYKDILTTGQRFTKETETYAMFKELMKDIATFIPHTKVKEHDYGLTWELPNGETILGVWDKDEGDHLGITGAHIAVPKTSPFYTVVNKLLAYVSSSVGYNKLTNKAIGLAEVEDKRRRIEEDKSKKEEVEKDEEEVDIPYLTKRDYFDIYLPESGSWGNRDTKYEEIKQTIKEIVDNEDVDGVSVLGLSQTEVVIDWVVNKETYTMALTEKATKVKELEVKYDMAIAYDTKHPELIKALMINKLQPLLEGN